MSHKGGRPRKKRSKNRKKKFCGNDQARHPLTRSRSWFPSVPKIGVVNNQDLSNSVISRLEQYHESVITMEDDLFAPGPESIEVRGHHVEAETIVLRAPSQSQSKKTKVRNKTKSVRKRKASASRTGVSPESKKLEVGYDDSNFDSDAFSQYETGDEAETETETEIESVSDRTRSKLKINETLEETVNGPSEQPNSVNSVKDNVIAMKNKEK